MALLRAIQSALATFFSKYSPLIFQLGLCCFVLLPALIFWGLIGAGCVILGVIALLIFILFSPILVPVGIVVGGVTSVTLAAVGIVVWRWKTIVRIGEAIVKAAKGMHLKFIQWLLTELEKMDATSRTSSLVPATPPRPQTPQDSTGTPSEDDTTPIENSPEKSEQSEADSSSSQTPEKSSSENGPTDDSFHSTESSARAGAKEKSLLFKSFLCICAGIALVQCALLVFFSFLAKNVQPYASAVLQMPPK